MAEWLNGSINVEMIQNFYFYFLFYAETDF